MANSATSQGQLSGRDVPRVSRAHMELDDALPQAPRVRTPTHGLLAVSGAHIRTICIVLLCRQRPFSETNIRHAPQCHAGLWMINYIA